MRKLIDANVILRYLLGDHPQMSEEARQIINEGAYTLPEVIAEVVYVLKGVYKIERDGQKALCIVYAGRFFYAENLDGGVVFMYPARNTRQH